LNFKRPDRPTEFSIYVGWPKLGGGAVPPFWGLGPHLTQRGPGIRGIPPYQVASWSIQPFGYNTPTSQTGQDRQWRPKIVMCTIPMQEEP